MWATPTTFLQSLATLPFSFFTFSFIGNDFKLAAVFAGGEAFFAFKDFAEVVRGGEAAFGGDFEDGIFFEAHHFAGGFDADNVEIGDEGHAHVLGEDVAEVIFGNSNGGGDLLNGERGVEIVIDVLDDGVHPRAVDVVGSGVAVVLRAQEEEDLEEKLGDEKLVGGIVLDFILVVFFQKLKEEILKLLGVVRVGGKDKGLVAHQLLDDVGREIFLQKAVFEVEQEARSAGAAGAVEQVGGYPDHVACFDVEKAILHKVFALAVENEIKLVGVVVVHHALRRFQRGFFDVKFLGGGVDG